MTHRDDADPYLVSTTSESYSGSESPTPKFMRLDPYKNFGQWARLGIAYIPSARNEIGQRAYQPDLFDPPD